MGNGCSSKKAVLAIEAGRPKQNRSDHTPVLPFLKLVFVGESLCGKTSIIKRFELNAVDEDYIPTKAVNIVSLVKKVNVPHQGIAKIELWDTPGHEDVDMRKSYYLDADAFVVITDISDESGLQDAIAWKNDVVSLTRKSRIVTESIPNDGGKTYSVKKRTEFTKPKADNIPILLLGNKFDVAMQKYMDEQFPEDPTLSRSNAILTTLPDSTSDDLLHNTTDVEKETENKSENIEANENGTTDDASQSISQDGKKTPDAEEMLTTEEAAQVEETPNAAVASNTEADDQCTNTGSKDDEEDVTPKESTEEETAAVIDDKDSSVNDDIAMDTKGAGDADVKPSGVNGDAPSPPRENGEHLRDVTNDMMIASTQKKFKKLTPKDLAMHDASADRASSLGEDVSLRHVLSTNHNGAEFNGTASSFMTFESQVSELPPCVENLERFAEENGFISGIPVSAVDAKGGVHEAVQSLIRHLVEKRELLRKRKNDDGTSITSSSTFNKRTRRGKNRTINEDFEPLQDVGIAEIDDVFSSCNEHLIVAELLATDYRKSIYEFKKACKTLFLPDNDNVNIEECITSLRSAIQSPQRRSNNPSRLSDIRSVLLASEADSYSNQFNDFSLTPNEDDEYIQLQVVDGNNAIVDIYKTDPNTQRRALPEDVTSVLQYYHTKVYPVCCDVLSSSEENQAILSQLSNQIALHEERAWDTAVAAGYKPAAVRTIVSILAQNKARVQGTCEQIKDTRKHVLTTKAKIRAALLF